MSRKYFRTTSIQPTVVLAVSVIGRSRAGRWHGLHWQGNCRPDRKDTRLAGCMFGIPAGGALTSHDHPVAQDRACPRSGLPDAQWTFPPKAGVTISSLIPTATLRQFALLRAGG